MPTWATPVPVRMAVGRPRITAAAASPCFVQAAQCGHHGLYAHGMFFGGPPKPCTCAVGSCRQLLWAGRGLHVLDCFQHRCKFAGPHSSPMKCARGRGGMQPCHDKTRPSISFSHMRARLPRAISLSSCFLDFEGGWPSPLPSPHCAPSPYPHPSLRCPPPQQHLGKMVRAMPWKVALHPPPCQPVAAIHDRGFWPDLGRWSWCALSMVILMQCSQQLGMRPLPCAART